jgi:hypothetical protein
MDLAAMYRNNGNLKEMNAKYISLCCSHNSFSRSYFSVICSNSAFILFSSFPYVVWLNLRLQSWFYVLSPSSLCFCLYLNSLLFRERQEPHYNPSEWKENFPGQIFNYVHTHTHTCTIYIKGRRLNSAQGNQTINIINIINYPTQQQSHRIMDNILTSSSTFMSQKVTTLPCIPCTRWLTSTNKCDTFV